MAVPTGGCPSQIVTIFGSMSPTQPGVRKFVPSHENVGVTSEEPYDPFHPSYNWLEMSHPRGKKGNKGKTGVRKNAKKKKKKAFAMEENETVKGKRQRTTRKEERISWKDLRAGGRDS